jgi:NADH-quinone oxidoreductase subunit C
MKEIKDKMIEQIKAAFPEAVNKDFDDNRLDFTVKKETVSSILFYLKEEMGFRHLSHIAYVDWIEEGEFELVYILWSPADKVKLFVHTRIDRENPVMDNIDMIWRQANTYEREIKEMLGIEFPGLVAPDEFILEDWEDLPPFRRDFDTLEYVNRTFWHRPGREDAQDVRETIAGRSGEEIPDFAQKYSR